GGQQGGGQQAGNQQGGRQGGQFNPNGQYNNGDAYGGGVYDPRQYANELRQDLNDLRELQRTLGPNNPQARDIEGIINNLQGLINNPRVGDAAAIAKLVDQVLEPFRGVEMELSRALQIMLAKENIRSAQ